MGQINKRKCSLNRWADKCSITVQSGAHQHCRTLVALGFWGVVFEVLGWFLSPLIQSNVLNQSFRVIFVGVGGLQMVVMVHVVMVPAMVVLGLMMR